MPRRKLIAFEDEPFQALDLLSRDSMKSFQELADEAFRDLLKKHRRPDDLRAALKASSKGSEARAAAPPQNPKRRAKTPSSRRR